MIQSLKGFKPRQDFILIRREEEETKGPQILLPDGITKEDDYEHIYVIVAVGTGGFTNDGVLLAMQYKKGDRIVLIPSTAVLKMRGMPGVFATTQFDIFLWAPPLEDDQPVPTATGAFVEA